jgi:glycosyltransferase involved in cell wall biosynthesis
MRFLVPISARRSRRLLTLSNAAKEDIVHFLEVPAERIDVTPLAAALGKDVPPVAEAELRRELALGSDRLVLTVSAKRPHKNLKRLIDAVGSLAEPRPMLVVPGYATAFEDDLKRHAEAVAPGKVRFAGWVDDATLAGLFDAADCFVFPSLAEGFGLPILDALSRGVPVACSGVSSLPEVGGEAVLYFDPFDSSDIARAIEGLLTDAPLRERLVQAGPRQAARFSWQATAKATAEAYRRALSARS